MRGQEHSIPTANMNRTVSIGSVTLIAGFWDGWPVKSSNLLHWWDRHSCLSVVFGRTDILVCACPESFPVLRRAVPGLGHAVHFAPLAKHARPGARAVAARTFRRPE